jgi:hypothetical protein
VSGHSAGTMQLILQHLYTGQVTLPSSPSQAAGAGSNTEEQGDVRSQVIQLLTAASYYLLPDLHAAVLTLAQKLVTPSTALRWLQAAHVAGEAALEKATLQFVRSNLDGGCGCNGSPCICQPEHTTAYGKARYCQHNGPANTFPVLTCLALHCAAGLLQMSSTSRS